MQNISPFYTSTGCLCHPYSTVTTAQTLSPVKGSVPEASIKAHCGTIEMSMAERHSYTRLLCRHQASSHVHYTTNETFYSNMLNNL